MTNLTPFKPGRSGNPNGRPKGRRTTINFDVARVLKDNKCDPFEILAKIATDKLDRPVTVRMRFEAASQLAQYVAPKLKAIEHSADPNTTFQFSLNTVVAKTNEDKL